MSGGSLDYAYYKVQSIAEDLQEDFKREQARLKEEGFEFDESIAIEVDSLYMRLQSLVPRLKDYEWWVDGDIGDDTYLERIRDRWEQERTGR